MLNIDINYLDKHYRQKNKKLNISSYGFSIWSPIF